MGVTKKQLAVINALQNGGWIWMAGTTPFLAIKDGEKVSSKPLHKRTFEGLVESDALVKVEENKYTLK